MFRYNLFFDISVHMLQVTVLLRRSKCVQMHYFRIALRLAILLCLMATQPSVKVDSLELYEDEGWASPKA